MSLTTISPEPDDDQPGDGLVSIAEVARMLGVDVRHVRRLVFEERVPYYKWGHLLRFDPVEIKAWLKQFRHEQRRGA
jgi:excisionase family DNA binding protein